MWKSSVDENLPVVGSAAAALLGGVVWQRLSARPSALWSEMICWAVLLVMGRSFWGRNLLQRHQKQHERQHQKQLLLQHRPTSPLCYRRERPSWVALWLVVLGLVTVAIFQTEFGADGFLPALTPMLLLAEQRLRPQLNMATPTAYLSLSHSLGGTTLVAALAVGTLSGWTYRGHVHSFLPTAALLLVYSVLTPRHENSSTQWMIHLPTLDLNAALLPLAERMVVVLAAALSLETYLFGLPWCHVATTVIAGVAKALAWYSLMQTTQHAPWRIASVIGTFSVMATRDPFIQTSDLQALLFVIVSLLSLAQVVHLVPREKAKYRAALWLFALVSLVPYLSNLVAIWRTTGRVTYLVHPVEHMMDLAQKGFDSMLQRQSQNYTAACDEYRRRYGMEPPPGFDGWFAFAQAQQSPIIDEFDSLHASLAPLYALSGQQVQAVMQDVYRAPNSELWLCTFSGKKGMVTGKPTHCSHHHRSFDRNLQLLFDTLLGNVSERLPDVQFLANHIDEPRVMVSSGRATTDHSITTLSHQPVWEKLTQFCDDGKEGVGKHSAMSEYVVNTYGFPFVQDRQAAVDLCRHPEYRDIHGLLMSPTSFHLIEGRVPVLTTGTLSTMGDILYPSAAYIEDEFRYDEASDVAWEQKQSRLYWAGSTTGGYAVESDGGRGDANAPWHNFQRQRFVSLAQNLDEKQRVYLEEDDDHRFVPRISSFLNGRLFDVAFTRVFQCDTAACRAQRAHFRTSAWAPRNAALQAKLTFDVDGNGISGRFYKLLASRSCPLKQTLLREWHDDRLIPWVHYVPVSAGLDELPTLVNFLTSPGPGDRAAHAIADQGRTWFTQALRPADMAVYMYRLLLELARLQDPTRSGTP